MAQTNYEDKETIADQATLTNALAAAAKETQAEREALDASREARKARMAARRAEKGVRSTALTGSLTSAQFIAEAEKIAAAEAAE